MRLLLTVVLLAGCGGPVSGVVAEKRHDPQDLTLIPITHPGTCSGSGTTRVCTPTWIQWVPVNDDEDWILVIQAYDGEYHEREVDAAYWESINVGDAVTEVGA